MKFCVGDIFYMLDEKKYVINAFIVLEENVKRTRQGEITTYTVADITNQNAAHVLSNDAITYTSLDDVKAAMVNNAAKAIEQIVLKAKEKLTPYLSNYIDDESELQKEDEKVITLVKNS